MARRVLLAPGRARAIPAGWATVARIVIAIGLGVLASWRLWYEPGVVGLLHDWAIAPFPVQFVLYAKMMYHGWFNGGLGSPFVYPSDYPIRWMFALLGAAGIGGGVLSKAVVFLVPSLSFLSGTYMCRVLTGNRWAAFAGGLFYALNPVVLNKIDSGQLAYLVSYPAMPAALGFAYTVFRQDGERGGIRLAMEGAAGGALLAIVAVQIQLAFLCVIATVIIAFTAPLRMWARNSITLALAGLIFGLCESPVILGILHGSGSVSAQAGFAPTIDAVVAQSVAFFDAVRLSGYVTHYEEFAVIDWSWLWGVTAWIAAAAAIFGLGVATRKIRLVALLCLAALLLFIVGALGPAAAVVIWLFQHITLMQTFREIYHLMAGVALLYSAGIAFASLWLLRLRWGTAANALLIVLIFVYGGIPLSSGDGGGWLHAFPIDSTYRQAFDELQQGNGRLMWLPLDQPMAFDGVGYGGDSLGGVTERGSIPVYALDWPLNALDYFVRRDTQSFVSLSEALGFSTIAQRGRMESRLARFTLVPELANHLFDSPFVTKDLGPPQQVIGDTSVYRLPHPLPTAFPATMVAIAPARASVGAALMMGGFAPIGFDKHPPGNVRYALFYDPHDTAYEALEAAHDTVTPQPFEYDARRGFAIGQEWWWFRKPYADNPSFVLSFGGGHTLTIPHGAVRKAKLTLAWISTPASAHIGIDAGSRHFVIDTRSASGESSDRSATLDLGNLRRSDPVVITTLDPYGDVALRGYGLLDGAREAADRRSFHSLYANATRREALREAPKLVAVSTKNERGIATPPLTAGATYRIQIRPLPGQALVVANSYGQAVATFDVVGHSSMAVAQFRSDGSTVTIMGAQNNQPWTLTRYTAKPSQQILPAKPTASSQRVVVFNVAYNRRWRLAGATAHLVSLLGTNIFVGGSGIRPTDTGERGFVQAFTIGTIALLTGLICVFALSRRKFAR